MDTKSLKPVLYVAEGILTGMGINYVWEVFKLPGYGIGVIPPVQGPGGMVGLGVDDLIILGSGAAIAVYGYKKKSTEMKCVGAGIAGGLALTKLFEAYAIQGYTVRPYFR